MANSGPRRYVGRCNVAKRRDASAQREWLATGDLATKKDSGELRFLGRKGEVIVTGAGMNVPSRGPGGCNDEADEVRGCVVVPCEMPSGPEPVAVVLFSGSDDELRSLVDRANRELAEYQQIRRVLRWPDLQFPYTSTGKILRRQVTSWACETVLGQTRASTAAPERDSLLNIIAKITGEPLSGVDDQWRLSEDLHLDSLGRVQLQSILEQMLHVDVADDAIADAATLGDLRALLNRGSKLVGQGRLLRRTLLMRRRHPTLFRRTPSLYR